MEVKIGVQYASRELVLESNEAPEELAATVDAAISAEQGTLSLVDEKGRRVIVPAAKLAYVEISEQSPRGVGFISSS